MNSRDFAAGILCLMLQAAMTIAPAHAQAPARGNTTGSTAQTPPAASSAPTHIASPSRPTRPAPTDLIGRPVDLDLAKGVQAPPRDASKLPTTFAEAVKTQPVDPKWANALYRPKNPRDLTGIWINQGGIGWTPGVPPGRAQNPPLTPAYAKIFQTHLANAAAGHPTGD